jgi:hypothetical protein
MADKRRIHVTKHPEGWEAKREGSKRAIKGEVIIHKEERNKIQEERTYRKDPHPPKG